MSWRDALINPFDFMNAAPVLTGTHNSGEADPPVTSDWAGAATDFPRGFDPHAFLDALEEPAPLFLRDGADGDIDETLQEIERLIGRAA